MKYSIAKGVKASMIGVGMLGFSLFAQGQEVEAKPEVVAAKLVVGDRVDASVLPKQWIQGEAVKSFEKDLVYVFDYWRAPRRGARKYALERHAPAYFARKAAEGIEDQSKLRFITLKINDRSSVERIKKFLKLPEFSCDHPIANDGDKGSVFQKWYLPMKLDEHKYGFIVKNGRLVWLDETYKFSEKLLADILEEDFTLEKFNEKQELRKKKFSAFYAAQQKAYKEGFAALKEGKTLEEAMQVADDLEKEYSGEVFFAMSLQELRYGIAIEAKDYDAARNALTDAIDQHPKQAQVLNRVNKFIAGSEVLRPESDAILIRSLELLAEVKGDKYAAGCWAVIGDMKEKAGDIDGAIEAYQTAVDRQPANQRLIAIKKGEQLPLAR